MEAASACYSAFSFGWSTEEKEGIFRLLCLPCGNQSAHWSGCEILITSRSLGVILVAPLIKIKSPAKSFQHVFGRKLFLPEGLKHLETSLYDYMDHPCKHLIYAHNKTVLVF